MKVKVTLPAGSSCSDVKSLECRPTSGSRENAKRLVLSVRRDMFFSIIITD